MTTIEPTTKKIKVNRLPRWLNPQIRKCFPDYPRDVYACYLFSWVQKVCGNGWLDHFGTMKDRDGRQLFISEPYNLSPRDIESLETFTKALGCSYGISGCAEWNDRCLRITIYPPDPEPKEQPCDPE